MAAFSDYLEIKLLNLTLRGTAYTPPGTVYVALFTTNPGESGSGTEVSGSGYARAAVPTSGGFSAPSAGATSNANVISFPTASGSWGTATHFAIFDASSGGNLMYYGALTAPLAVTTFDVFSFQVGDLSITLD